MRFRGFLCQEGHEQRGGHGSPSVTVPFPVPLHLGVPQRVEEKRPLLQELFVLPHLWAYGRVRMGWVLLMVTVKKQRLPLGGSVRLPPWGGGTGDRQLLSRRSSARLQGLNQPVELVKSFILHLISCSDQYGFLEQFGGL